MTLEETMDAILNDPFVIGVRVERDMNTRKFWATIVQPGGVGHVASSKKSYMHALAEAVLRWKRSEPVTECEVLSRPYPNVPGLQPTKPWPAPGKPRKESRHA